jgi:2-polyprenyl-3-methyl-5-hydroxy-6-metoxy-1,4-benzoquinol methylase
VQSQPPRPPGDLAGVGTLARGLYQQGPAALRFLQHHRHRIAPVARLLELVPAGSRVLDVGCGGGLLLNLLAATGRLSAGHGFDSAAPAVAVAQAAARRLAGRGAGCVPSFECRPVEAGFPSGEWDVVFMVDVMHHVPPPAQEAAFLEAASRVQPGGLLVYKDMCDAPAWRAGMNRLHDLVVARQWIHYAPIESVDRWASEAGLVAERAEWIPILWYGHELRAYRRPGAGR